MKMRIFLMICVISIFTLYVSSAFASSSWSGDLNLQVIADASTTDGKRGVYTNGGIMYRSFNYPLFPDGYAYITGHGVNPPSYNLNGGLQVRSGGNWVNAASSYVWFSSEIGTYAYLPINSSIATIQTFHLGFMSGPTQMKTLAHTM